MLIWGQAPFFNICANRAFAGVTSVEIRGLSPNQQQRTMTTQVVNKTAGDQRTTRKIVRVAVAGASGFAGQELIRLLSRHPNATITAATGSQATSTPRRLPSLAKIWDGTVVPLNAAAFAADAVFLALPEAASAELAPMLLKSGLRVIDLSGAFRLRDAAARARF